MSQVAWTTCLACRWVIWKLHKFNKSLAAWLFNTLPRKPTYSSYSYYSITPRLHRCLVVPRVRDPNPWVVCLLHMPQHTWLRTLAEQIEDSCQSLLPSVSWFVLSVLFSTFFLCLFESIALSPRKPFPSHGLTLLVYNCLSRPKDLAMCNVQSKAEMGTHALHAPQRICKVCKEKNTNLKRCKANILKGFDVKERTCEKRSRNGTPWHSSINARVSPILTGVTVAQIVWNSSMLWVRKAIYTKHLREEGVRFVACIEVNSNPSLLLSWF